MGIRVQDLFDPGILQQKLEVALREKNQILDEGLQPPGDRRRRGRATSTSAYAERLRPHVADTALVLDAGARRRRDRAARGRAGHAARRRPRHLSVRHLVQPDRRRRVHRLGHRPDPDRAGDRHRQGVHDPRRRPARSRPSCSTRSASTCARPAASSASTTGRAPPLRLVRRGDRPLRHPGQRRHRLLPHQARRPVRRWRRCRSASRTRSTASGTTRCR